MHGQPVDHAGTHDGANELNADSSHAQRAVVVAVVTLALLLPWSLAAAGQDYYVSAASRVLIYAIAASSLNLVIGYGGLVSFGHAAFFGIGAYTVGVLITEGFAGGWSGFALAVLVSALFALVVGAVSLRTRGVHFIMITLAFAQMLYYLVNSVKAYGGDEGLNIKIRSDFGFGLDLKNDTTFYYVALLALLGVLYGTHRLMRSRFGKVVRAIRDNEERAGAIGYPVFAFKLTLFVIAGALGGLAGALMVNQQNYVSPTLLYWTQSGTLMMMVILGGVGRLWGGVIGATVFLGLETLVSGWTVHWPFYVGWVLLAVVLFAPGGIAGLVAARRAPQESR